LNVVTEVGTAVFVLGLLAGIVPGTGKLHSVLAQNVFPKTSVWHHQDAWVIWFCACGLIVVGLIIVLILGAFAQWSLDVITAPVVRNNLRIKLRMTPELLSAYEIRALRACNSDPKHRSGLYSETPLLYGDDPSLLLAEELRRVNLFYRQRTSVSNQICTETLEALNANANKLNICADERTYIEAVLGPRREAEGLEKQKQAKESEEAHSRMEAWYNSPEQVALRKREEDRKKHERQWQMRSDAAGRTGGQF